MGMIKPFTLNPELSDDCIEVYGDWDDVTNHQFMVMAHPNGVSCAIYFMGGCDYGGGISERVLDLDLKKVYNTITEYRDARTEQGYYEYDIHDFEKLVKSGALNRV